MKKIVIILCVLVCAAVVAWAALQFRSKGSSSASQSLSTGGASSSSKALPSIPKPPSLADSQTVIADIRSELKKVMELNTQVSSLRTNKAEQILRIQEQAAIHQKILSAIEQESASKKSEMPSREVLLAQEKLRIIREETLKNKKLLEEATASKTA